MERTFEQLDIWEQMNIHSDVLAKKQLWDDIHNHEPQEGFLLIRLCWHVVSSPSSTAKRQMLSVHLHFVW